MNELPSVDEEAVLSYAWNQDGELARKRGYCIKVG